MFQLNLSSEQMQVLAGLLDAAIKSIGIRAMEDDVIGLLQAVKTAQPAPPPEEPED